MATAKIVTPGTQAVRKLIQDMATGTLFFGAEGHRDTTDKDNVLMKLSEGGYVVLSHHSADWTTGYSEHRPIIRHDWTYELCPPGFTVAITQD